MSISINMWVFLNFAVFSFIFGCVSGQNLIELARKLGATDLINFVKDAGLEDTLATGGNFTVFAPTNTAFEALPPDVVNILKNNKTVLRDVLKFHVIGGKVFKKDLSDELVVPTLNEKDQIRINYYEDNQIYTATGSVVATFDQEASNGVIHVINRVMFPLPTDNLVSYVVKNKEFDILVKAVTQAKLVDTLSGKGPFTLFAPTDAAFKASQCAPLPDLLKNITALTEVLTYHVVPKTYYSAGLVNGLTIRTIEGKHVDITINGGSVMVDQANVVQADIPVTNGVIHVIDSVLCPPEYSRKHSNTNMNLIQLAEKLGAKILVHLVKYAGLEQTLATGGTFTVFAPTDAAFEAIPPSVINKLKNNMTLLTEVLTFHVIKGKVFKNNLNNELVVPSLNSKAQIRINYYEEKMIYTATGSIISTFDQEATNGVIHVIDRVMFPLPTDDLVSTVNKIKDLDILVHAVKIAKLESTLSGKGPFTLFAPTNAAFDALPCGALAMLLKNITALTEVLTYHVVQGTYYSAGLADGLKIPTVEGKDIKVRIDGGRVMVNQASVVKADIPVTNGVIHVIDSVLLPIKKYFRKRPHKNMLFRVIGSIKKMYGRRF